MADQQENHQYEFGQATIEINLKMWRPAPT